MNLQLISPSITRKIQNFNTKFRRHPFRNSVDENVKVKAISRVFPEHAINGCGSGGMVPLILTAALNGGKNFPYPSPTPMSILQGGSNMTGTICV
jgi:hypothetical protein